MDSDVRAELHIHRVDARCATAYLGSVPLDRPSLAVGLPSGQAAYLVVTFDTSSFLGGSRRTSTATVLTPRSAHQYALAVRYHDSIYDVALAESDAHGGRAHRLPLRDLEECRG